MAKRELWSRISRGTKFYNFLKSFSEADGNRGCHDKYRILIAFLGCSLQLHLPCLQLHRALDYIHLLFISSCSSCSDSPRRTNHLICIACHCHLSHSAIIMLLFPIQRKNFVSAGILPFGIFSLWGPWKSWNLILASSVFAPPPLGVYHNNHIF